MEFIVANNIRVKNPDKKILDYAERKMVIANPNYIKNQYLGYSNYNTPRNLVYYELDGNDLILPFGCLSDLFKLYPGQLFKNNIVLGEKIKYKSNIKLFDYQEEACNAAITLKNGILVMPAGSGKTQTALEIIARLGYKALWITHTIDLLNQSYTRAKSNFKGIGLGKIANGKIEIGTHITFATVQTLSKIDLIEYADKWDCIIVDECHRVCGTPASAGMFYKVINKLIARYKYGLTATPYRNIKGTEKAMFGLLGNIIVEIPKETIEKRLVPATIVKVKTNYIISDECLNTDGTLQYAKLTTDLAEDNERNKIIVDILNKRKNNYCLVLSDRLNQLKFLNNEVPGLIIDGKMTSIKMKKYREECISKIRRGDVHILYATYGLAKEGLDIPRLDTLVLATPHRDKATVIQAVGRVERKFEDKKEPIVYDLVDGTLYFEKMYKARRRYYKENKNKIIEE